MECVALFLLSRSFEGRRRLKGGGEARQRPCLLLIFGDDDLLEGRDTLVRAYVVYVIH